MDIKLEKISLKDKKNVLENIDLEVKSGTITVLLSNNYKKLKALLSILSINQTPTSGDIFLNGQKIKDFNNQKQNIGFCPNTIHFKHKTIKEELETILESKRKKINEKRIEDTLKMVGLTPKYLLKNPNELSSGEKQKLSLATILVYNPKIIILENPTKNLDSKNKATLIKLLKLMKLRYKKTIIIATKDSEMILSLADQIYLLSENKLTKYEDKYIFFSDDKLLESYHLEQPKIIKFSKIVKEKTNISIGYRDNINDLIKDVYRYVEQNK